MLLGCLNFTTSWALVSWTGNKIASNQSEISVELVGIIFHDCLHKVPSNFSKNSPVFFPVNQPPRRIALTSNSGKIKIASITLRRRCKVSATWRCAARNQFRTSQKWRTETLFQTYLTVRSWRSSVCFVKADHLLLRRCFRQFLDFIWLVSIKMYTKLFCECFLENSSV